MGKISTATAGGLADALFSSVQRKVLALLFGRPERDYSTSDVIRFAKSGTGAVHRELARLAASGLVTVTQIGNQKRYRANPESPVFDELRGIVLKTAGLADPLREALSPLADRIDAAFVYGSVAAGRDRADSDIDLMVVGDDLAYAEVYDALRQAEEQLGRSVNPTVASAAALRRKIATGSAFAKNLSRQPRLMVLGSDDVVRSPP